MSDKKLPNLLLFPQEESPDSTGLLFNLKDDNGLIVKFLKNSGDTRCSGSSYDWLVMLEGGNNHFLLNPFKGFQIQLPILQYPPDFPIASTDFVTKSLLTSDPFEKQSDSGCRVVVIYGAKSRIGYCRIGDCSSWVDLDCRNKVYCDITFYDNRLFALSGKGSVEIWGFQGNLVEHTEELKLPFPTKTVEIGNSLRDLCATNCYLVESRGEILLVVRFIGEFVNQDGEPICESDLLTDDDPHPLVCPYRTLFFHVYKLDFDGKKWVDMESLGDDRALFLGVSQSKSVLVGDCNECKGNSIYFTDDYWERMDEDYLYGGHDIGVFHMEDRSVTPFSVCGMEKILPPPIWVNHD